MLVLIPIQFAAFGQQREPENDVATRILFIFDASQSMNGIWESDRKINIARRYLTKIIDSLENIHNIQMALRIYGHQKPVPPQDCSDTRLEVPFSDNNASSIRQKLKYLSPKGTTPIAYSLQQSQRDFPPCEDCRNIIILITDGVEACDGDPCEVSKELQKNGIILRPFVIGIGIDPNFEKTFSCVGNFYNTPQEDQFENVLGVVISRALNSTTAQVNLLDKTGMPTETDVPMTFFDNFSGKVKQNYIHTINYKGNPDTLVLDPLVTYDLIVHTIPPVRKDSIVLIPGKHNMIGIDAPQGFLNITSSSTAQYRDIQVIVKNRTTGETVNIQRMDETLKYLEGNYSLQILTLPVIHIENVIIEQSHTTTIEVPKPGIGNFLMSSPGYGSIFYETPDTLYRIYNFNPNRTRESIVLQPGNYRVIFRGKNVKNTLYTHVKRFVIKSGSSKKIVLH